MQPGEVTVGFDIGGTNLRAGVLDGAGELLAQATRPTPRTTEGLEDTIAELVGEYRLRYPVGAVGIALAAFLDPDCETVRFAPHLSWRDTPVRALLEERLGVPVRLEHDANSAAWGEYRLGAARGAETWVYFAVGTGIGATLMTGGEIYRGAYGTAPEFGHITVVPGGRPCPCGKLGCLERYCSGSALVDTAVELVHQKSFPESALASRVRRDPRAVRGQEIMAAAEKGDPAGRAVAADFAHWLGVGLSVVADILDPELVVLGGGVAAAAGVYLDDAREQFASHIVGTGYRPLAEVRVGELGRNAGMIGVAELARHVSCA